MPSVGFESTTPVFERAKAVDASDLAAAVIGLNTDSVLKYSTKMQIHTTLTYSRS
jgi:hypothetical protein